MKYLKYFLFIIAVVACSATMYQAVRHDGTLTGDGTTASPLGLNRGTEITPTSLTSDQDNYNPTGWDDAITVRLSGDARLNAITSLTPPTASTKPQEKTLLNVGSYMIYFPMDHPDGTAANRFTGNGSDFKLYPGKSCQVLYDGTSSRWRVLSEENSAGKKVLTYLWSPTRNATTDFEDVGILTIGTGTITITDAATPLPSCATLSTSTNAAWGYTMYSSKSIGETFGFGDSHIYTEALISIPTLSDVNQTFTVELQITGTVAANLEENNTVAIRYSNAINGGEWELFSQDNAGSESVADLDVAVQANTLYLLRVEIDKAKSETRAYINGAYVGRVTGSMPTTTKCGGRVVLLKSNGGTARTLNVHSFNAGAIYP